MNRIICIYILLFLGVPCLAQQTKEYQQQVAYAWLPLFEQLCDYDDIEEHDMEDMFEQLCELEQTPLDLNKATDEDLLRLFFLSPKQREDLTEYLDRYRPLRSIGELALVESVDPLRKQLLESFCFISEANEERPFPTLKQIAKYGKNELVAATQVPLYDREGDRNGYLGYKYKTLVQIHIQIWRLRKGRTSRSARRRRAVLLQLQQAGLRPLCLLSVGQEVGTI